MCRTFSGVTVFAFFFMLVGTTNSAYAQVNGGAVVQLDGGDDWLAGGDAIGGVFSLGSDLEIDFAGPDGDGQIAGEVIFPFSNHVVFDATAAEISVDFTLGDNNTLDFIDVLLLDFDGGQTDEFSELFVYRFLLDGLAANVRHSATLPLIAGNPAEPFTPGPPGTQPFLVIPFGAGADLMVNFDGLGGLGELALGLFGGARAELTVHEIRIEAIPEPSGVALFSLGTVLLLSRRRR